MSKSQHSEQRHGSNDCTPGCKTTIALGVLLALGLIVQNSERIQALLPVIQGIARGDIDEVENTLVAEWIAEHPQEIEKWRNLTVEDLVKIQEETRDPRKHAALSGAILEAMERDAEREYSLKEKK